MAPSLLLITRKYPPGRGGMEEFSCQLFRAYRGEKRLVALRRGQGWLSLFLLQALLAARRHRGTVTHVHLGDALLTPLAPLIDRLSGAPVTATVHGLDAMRRLPPYRRLVGSALRRASGRLVAVSAYTADAIASLYGAQAIVIANGVDVERFIGLPRARDPATDRTGLGLPPAGPLIVTVGRLVERKGVAWFIDQVMPRLPATVTFAVVGDGPHRRWVRRAALRDPRVVPLGSRDDRAVATLYACADLFVAPNIAVPGQPEGYGIAPAEAAAAGLPVLVSDLQGLRQMAGDTGVHLLPAGEAAPWASSVLQALACPSDFIATRPVRSWAAVSEEYTSFFAAIASRPVRHERV